MKEIASKLGRLAVTCSGVIVVSQRLEGLAQRLGVDASYLRRAAEELVRARLWVERRAKSLEVYVDPTLLSFLASCKRVRVEELFERLAPKGIKLGEVGIRDDYYVLLSHPEKLHLASLPNLEKAYVEAVIKALHERKYFTREGDWGLSYDEISELWIPKPGLLWEFFGKLDEVESLMMYAAAMLRERGFEKESSILDYAVNVLFELGTLVYRGACCLDPTTTLDLESFIAEIGKGLEVSGFKKAYRKAEAALLAVVRACVRELERRLLVLEALTGYRDPNAKRFLNRLSSLLFVLSARVDEHQFPV